MSTFVFSPKHKGALDRPLVVALVDKVASKGPLDDNAVCEAFQNTS
jgi:hypothetical protein